MKLIKTTKSALLPLLEAASKFAGPVFTSVDNGVENKEKDKTLVLRLVFSENKLEVQAMNVSTGINMWLPIDNQDEVSYLLPAKLLTETVSKCETEDIKIGLEKNHLVVQSTSGKTSLKEIPDENPIPPVQVPTYSTGMLCSDFSHALNMVAFASAKNDSRPALNGVKVDLSSDNDITLVGTDGFRLSVFTAPLLWQQLGREEYEKGFIIPLKTATTLISCLAKQVGNIKIGVSSVRFAVEWDNGYVFSNLVEERFPDWNAILPLTTKTKIKFINGFQNAIKAAKVLAFSSITFDVTNERTFVRSGSDIGNSLIKLTPEYNGSGSMEIMFDQNFIPDHVGGEILIGLNAPNAPAIFESSTEPGWKFLLMPVKLNA